MYADAIRAQRASVVFSFHIGHGALSPLKLDVFFVHFYGRFGVGHANHAPKRATNDATQMHHSSRTCHGLGEMGIELGFMSYT